MQKYAAKSLSQNQKQNILPQNLDAKYAPKNHAIEIGCKNLVKHYATKIVPVNSMQKPKPKFVGIELTSRSHI